MAIVDNVVEAQLHYRPDLKPGATDPDLLKQFLRLANTVRKNTKIAKRFDDYYDGKQKLLQLGISIPEDLRVLETVINWPRLVVDSLAQRMTIQGFICSGGEKFDKKCWEWWQANDMDKESRLAHVETLVQGKSYITVTVDEDDPKMPRFAVETSKSMTVEHDPRTRKIAAAALVWGEGETQHGAAQYGALYLPNSIEYFDREGGKWRHTPERSQVHNLGVVPVIPMTNRARIGDREGRSEITDIIPITDFASRLMTNLQVAQEFLAVPQRYALGVQKEDFVDRDGNQIDAWKAYIGNIWSLSDPAGTIGQLEGADLRNFVEVFNMLARQVSSLSDLPPHALGLTTSNPASADAIRSGESALVQRILDRESSYESAWEEAMRIGLMWTGTKAAKNFRFETSWANPETPTFASKADAVVKLVAIGILPPDAALEELGYSPEVVKKYSEMREVDPMLLLTGGTMEGADDNTSPSSGGPTTANVAKPAAKSASPSGNTSGTAKK